MITVAQLSAHFEDIVCLTRLPWRPRLPIILIPSLGNLLRHETMGIHAKACQRPTRSVGQTRPRLEVEDFLPFRTPLLHSFLKLFSLSRIAIWSLQSFLTTPCGEQFLELLLAVYI